MKRFITSLLMIFLPFEHVAQTQTGGSIVGLNFKTTLKGSLGHVLTFLLQVTQAQVAPGIGIAGIEFYRLGVRFVCLVQAARHGQRVAQIIGDLSLLWKLTK